MRANWQELKEERKMCEALRELFADDLRESGKPALWKGRTAGKIEGRIEGKLEGKIELIIKKYKKRLYSRRNSGYAGGTHRHRSGRSMMLSDNVRQIIT